MAPRTLLIRADASVAIGTGHVMRCLALAQAWQDVGGVVMFAMAESTPAIRSKLLTESCEVSDVLAEAGAPQDAEQTIALTREKSVAWVVVDGYQFSTEYQTALKRSGNRVLMIDDLGHVGRYVVDLVLNQNISVAESLYQNRETRTHLLLGPKYCLLRREFSAWRDHKRKIPEVGSRLLITLGGSDPENVTACALQALREIKLKNLDVIVVIGGSNPHFESLESSAAELVSQSGMKIEVRRDVSNMPELLAWADVAISAAGSTCWEICLLGLPALLIDVAQNQTAVARELHHLGCAIHLGSSKEIVAAKVGHELQELLNSPARRRSISQHCQALVDVKGAGRVIAILRAEDLGDEQFHLRRAREEDSRLLWGWANDADVRASAFSSEPILWESHVAWFSEKLRGGKCFIWIAENEAGTPLGQIRFDVRDDGDCEVDVSLARTHRGLGLAGTLIKMGVENMHNQRQCRVVHAFVKPMNVSSLKAFKSTGFKQIGTEQVRGNAAIHFVYDKRSN